MKNHLSFRLIASFSLLGFAVIFSGCKTIDSAAAAKFATSVTTVKSQANDALNAAAKLTRDEGVVFVATRPTLTEADFAETPTSDVVAEWENTLSTIETYALNLAALSAPDITKNFDAAATNLFGQFNQTANRLKANSLSSSASISAGLASGFSEAARLILMARSQATARKVAATTDGQIQEILNLLASEIGEDHVNPSLRTTIYRIWNVKKDALTGSFLRGENVAAKTVVAQQYAEILAERAAQDQALLGLRRSLLALGDAHHGLAQGNETSIQTSLTIVISELQRTRDLYSQFNGDFKNKTNK